jgi:anti-sigma B factor antagonist
VRRGERPPSGMTPPRAGNSQQAPVAWITVDKHGPLTVRTEKMDDTLILRAIGDLDLVTTPAFEESMRRALEGDASSIVIDLMDVGFLDASGIRLVLWAQQQTRAAEGRILITESAAVRRILPD